MTFLRMGRKRAGLPMCQSPQKGQLVWGREEGILSPLWALSLLLGHREQGAMRALPGTDTVFWATSPAHRTAGGPQ